MRRCPARKKGIRFIFSGYNLLVRPHSPSIIGELRQTIKDVEQLPPEIQGAIVTGYLVASQKHGRVLDFNFTDIEEPGSAAAGA